MKIDLNKLFQDIKNPKVFAISGVIAVGSFALNSVLSTVSLHYARKRIFCEVQEIADAIMKGESEHE